MEAPAPPFTSAARTKLVSTKTEKITPKKAQQYLDLMQTNRKLRQRLVDRYAAEMAAGQWKAGASTIKFNKDGELIDGQHRLSAIIQSGKTIEFDVRRDLDREVFMVLDTGGTRSPGDMLHVAGFQYTSNIASAIRQASSILEVEAGVIKPTSMGKKRIAPAVLLEWAQEHEEELVEACRECMSRDAKVVCSPPSLFAECYFLFAQYNRKAAREFFEILIQGIGFELGDHDPIYQLRKQLLSFKANKNIKRPAYYKAALVIKAWNAYQNRETIHQLKFVDGESWPEISRRRGRVSEAQAKKNRDKQARRRRQLKAADKRRQSKKKAAKAKKAS
jgi:hypothetical protein